jgi:hypothetical protein
MHITKVLAVYRSSPLLLVVEAEDGTVVELSLKEMQDGGHRLSDAAWKELLADYQLFTGRATPRQESGQARRARQPRPPASD